MRHGGLEFAVRGDNSGGRDENVKSRAASVRLRNGTFALGRSSYARDHDLPRSEWVDGPFASHFNISDLF
jgi:hypothetical protein